MPLSLTPLCFQVTLSAQLRLALAGEQLSYRLVIRACLFVHSSMSCVLHSQNTPCVHSQQAVARLTRLVSRRNIKRATHKRPWSTMQHACSSHSQIPLCCLRKKVSLALAHISLQKHRNQSACCYKLLSLIDRKYNNDGH